MKCRECREQLSEYQAGDLREDISRAIEEHLGECPECAAELAAFDKLDNLVDKLAQLEPAAETILNIKNQTVFKMPEVTRKTEFGPVMDMAELADFMRVSIEAVEESIDELPCFEFGGKILFRRKSIEEWLEHKERDHGFSKLESDVNSILAGKDLF
ncbi:zf-HC2 domain-containing protein [Planctomycetota bacterium]